MDEDEDKDEDEGEDEEEDEVLVFSEGDMGGVGCGSGGRASPLLLKFLLQRK